MANKKMTDTEVLESIARGGAARKKALNAFFKREKLLHTVIQQVSRSGGTANEASDIYQESVIIFDRNIRAGKFKGNSNLETYFIGIAKWLWVAQRRKQGRETELNLAVHDSALESHEESLFTKDRKQLLDKALKSLGTKCRLILKLWAESFSMKEIAVQVGFMKNGIADEIRAKKEAYRCRKRLSEFVQSHPHLMESLSALR